MELTRLQALVTAHLAERAPELGLDAARLDVRYLLNRGGFVNRSFRVTDGRATCHLKLACYAPQREGVRRSWELRALLRRHRAPEALAWIEVPGTGWDGVLSPWLDGAPPASIDGLADDVVATFGGLHADAELGARLAARHAPVTCADAFRRAYADRFVEDLGLVGAERPPFVSAATLEWMRREAASVEAAVSLSPAFAEPADAPTHGDPWLDNLLVTRDGTWFVVDWDALALGDPALDWAMLFGPTRTDPRTATDRELPPGIPSGPSLRARLAVLARASLLDWTLDPLADWIVAGEAPEHVAKVRAEKERIHRAALAACRGSRGVPSR